MRTDHVAVMECSSRIDEQPRAPMPEHSLALTKNRPSILGPAWARGRSEERVIIMIRLHEQQQHSALLWFQGLCWRSTLGHAMT